MNAFQFAKDYVERAIASYVGDPADNQFQKGYLAALEVVRDEAFAQSCAVAQSVGNCGGMPWVKAETDEIDLTAYYLVKDNGDQWRDFDLHVMHGRMVQHKLNPDYVRGRPEWIAKIDRPSSLTSTSQKSAED